MGGHARWECQGREDRPAVLRSETCRAEGVGGISPLHGLTPPKYSVVQGPLAFDPAPPRDGFVLTFLPRVLISDISA